MKKYNAIIRTLCLLLFAGTLFTACKDDIDTNLYNKGGVNLLAFGPCPVLRTNEIRITGTNMQNVDKVVFPGAEPVSRSEFNKVDNENIYVNVPDASVPGKIKLVVGSDTVTSVTPITFEEHITVDTITPVKGLNPGDIITISGEYVYNIASVTFTAGVEVLAEDFVKSSRKEVQVEVPLAAESGTVTLSDGADWSLEYTTPLEIIAPSVSGVDPATTDFGQTITIKGNNLHAVEQVLFAGGVDAAFICPDKNNIRVVVPEDAMSGAISLVTYSGATVTTPEVTLPQISITSCSKTEDICAGDEIVVTGENFDRIKQVFLGNDELTSDKYTISGNTLTFSAPEGMGDCDLKLVQNANISVTQALAVRKLAGVIWQGSETLSGWSNWGVFSWSGDIWTKFQAAITGAGQLTIHFKQLQDNPQFNCKMGDWSTSFTSTDPAADADGIFRPAAGVEDLVINLSAEEADKMFGSGAQGIVIWGDGIQLQYIKFVAAGAEKVLWEGEAVADNWSDQPYLLSDAGTELQEANAQEGDVIRFYVTPMDTNWKLQIVEGHWGDTYGSWCNVGNPDTEGGKFSEWDLEANGGCVKFALTQDMLDKAYTQQWWGGTFLANGDKVKITKITLAPM